MNWNSCRLVRWFVVHACLLEPLVDLFDGVLLRLRQRLLLRPLLLSLSLLHCRPGLFLLWFWSLLCSDCLQWIGGSTAFVAGPACKFVQKASLSSWFPCHAAPQLDSNQGYRNVHLPDLNYCRCLFDSTSLLLSASGLETQML